MIQPANHWLFQLANSFLLVSYVSRNMLMLRITLSLAGLCFLLWGWYVLDKALDTFLWNLFFCIVNSVQAAIIIYNMYPVKFGSDEFEKVYQVLFGRGQYNLPRSSFKKLSEVGYIRHLHAGSSYVDAGNEAASLSIVVSGGFKVVVKDRLGKETVVNHIRADEFIDSPQWFSRTQAGGARFMVTIRAEENTTFITWPYENLLRVFPQVPGLESCINFLAGVDVARKLFSLDEHVGAPDFQLSGSGMSEALQMQPVKSSSQYREQQEQSPTGDRVAAVLGTHDMRTQPDTPGRALRAHQDRLQNALRLFGQVASVGEPSALKEQEP